MSKNNEIEVVLDDVMDQKKYLDNVTDVANAENISENVIVDKTVEDELEKKDTDVPDLAVALLQDGELKFSLR